MKRLGDMPLGVVGACSGPSGAPSVAPVVPDRCLRPVLPNTGRGVVHLAERVLLLDSFTTVVPIGNSRSAFSRGGVVSVFARNLLYLRQVWVVQVSPCMENIELWSVEAAGDFCFGHQLGRFAIVMFTALIPHGYAGCRCYVSAVAEGVERFSYYGWGG